MQIEGVPASHRVACHYVEDIASGAIAAHTVTAEAVDPTLAESDPSLDGSLIGPSSIGEATGSDPL